MTVYTKATIVVGISLLVAGVAIRSADDLLPGHRSVVLEGPVILHEGFSLTHQFTVDVACEYWLGIALQKSERIEPSDPVPADNFSVAFTISSDAGVLAAGDNSSTPRSAIVAKDRTTRILSRFHAEPRTIYNLSFRVTRAAFANAPTKANLLIFVDPHSKPNTADVQEHAL